uniref:C2 domain-containing protein n=1 Tax=Anopheles culicifacies TaxID=139723 RepID=A0A182MJG1_9DIPT
MRPERPNQLSDESDWMSDYADSNLKRRSSISKDYLAADAEDDNGSTRDPDVQPYPNPHLPRKQSQSSYPSLVKHPYFNPLSMADEDEYGEEEEERHGSLEVGGGNHRPSALRRAMPRQSTLPNPEGIYYGSNNNLMPPVSVSPKQQLSPSPQYNTSPYHTDNEADNETGSDHRSPLAARYKIRRQSTLPCKPNEMLMDGGGSGSGAGPPHGSGPKIMMSSSPNSRTNLYSKSPERDGIDTASSKQQQRFPPFATLPNPEQHMKLLPTSPPKKQLSPHSIKRSPDFARQNTLPASQQQPPPPPQPQQQQQAQQQPVAGPQSAPVLMPMTLAASSCTSLVSSDGTTGTVPAVTMNSLSVHQHGPKFMPISPRQKASFLFPQPAAPTPRPFHSQQHFPTHLNTSPSASAVSSGVTGTGAVPGIGVSHSSSTSLSTAVTSKMIKVRSHSNEEYTMAPATRAGLGMGTVSEGRRMLPEIPTGGGGPGHGGSRSPRLVRQEHVRDELLIGCVNNSAAGQGPCSDKRTTTSSSSSPKQKTFAEAKQTMAEDMMGYELYGSGGQHSAAIGYEEFYDEDQEFSLDPIETGARYPDGEDARGNEQFNVLQMQQQQRLPFVPNDSSPDSLGGTQAVGYGLANRKDRLRSRRKSRDAYDQQDEVSGTGFTDMSDGGSAAGAVVATTEPIKRKPETMRSISEEAPAAKPPKPVTRRSLSHPEKDTQVYSSKKLDSSKIPSPKPLTELQDRQHKPSGGTIGSSTSPRRKNIKSFDCGTVSTKAANLQPGVYTQYQTPSDGGGSGGPASVSPGIVTESSISSNTRTSGYGGSATTLAGNIPGGGPATTGGGAIGGFQSFGQRKISAFQQILQRQRLQKRDSKSLDIVASKLMEEKYGSRGQDVDVSKSLDDGIFSESAGHQSDDNSSDEHINLSYKPSSKDNKTTLGEAEIQNAVEAAAVIFKKVVLQRREENKCKSSHANHECHSSADGLTDESATLGGYSSSETEAAAGRMQSFGPGIRSRVMPSDYEEYRLVFFSSDSSSKEEEYDSSSTSSSTAVRHAKRHRYTTTASLDECDWDYFEPDMMPGADETKSAFFYEMLAMATATAKCVGSVHGHQCKNTTSATKGGTNAASGGRKLNNRAEEPSLAVCHCECCNRRHMQYVPIPVPVPVPVPIAAFQSWLYEQQQQLLLMHGTTDTAESSPLGSSVPSSASDYALRTDLVQQLWKKFADSSETSVRNGALETETSAGGTHRKVPIHPKCACRFGSSRRDLVEACATSESHDSSDNERNATKVRTCKHLNVRHKNGADSERAFGPGRASSASSGSEATAANSRVHHVQKATPTPYGVMRRDCVGGGSVSDSRCSLTSSDHDDVGSSSGAVAVGTALQLAHRQQGVVVPPLRAGEFPLAVPVTTNAANDIVTTPATLAKPIQAQDNIVVAGEKAKTANVRVQAREIKPDSNVRASVAATSSSLVATAEPGLDTATMDDDQRLLCSGNTNDGDTGLAELSQNNDIDLRARERQQASASQCSVRGDMDGNVNSDNKGSDTDNNPVDDGITYLPDGAVVKAMEKNQPPSIELATTALGEENRLRQEHGGSSEVGKCSKIRTTSTDEQDGYLQYELLYHLAQTGGRSSPSSSSASSSEAENTSPADQQQLQHGRKTKVGKYSFQLTGSSGGNSSYNSSPSSSVSSLAGKSGSDLDTDGEEDYFDRDHHELDGEREDDDGCCFDGEDDDEDDADDGGGGRRHHPRGARNSGKRFNAVMVINPGHGSDGEGPSDSDSSDDNQSIRTEGEHSWYGEVAGFPPTGGYADEEGGAGGIVVLKRVKNISDFDETECANEQRPKPLVDDKLVRNCAEVSIEQAHNSSIEGSRRRTLETTVVDHRQQSSSMNCTAAPKGGSRKSGETDSSPLPNGEQALVDQCCANVGESNAHQQQLEEKGTVSRQAPAAASGYAPDAYCQQEHRSQQRSGSIKVEEKPQHDDHHHHHNQDALPTTGNSINSSSVTGVYRVRTPTLAQDANAATCVSTAAVDECVSGATATHTGSVALGDIRSPQTPHTVEAVPSSSTTIGGSNKYKSLVMITDDTSDTDSSRESKNNIDREVKPANESCIPSEGVVADEVQVNVASSSPTTTTSKTVPSGEDIVRVSPDPDHDEITVSHIQNSASQSVDHYAVAETLCSLQSLPECLPGQSQTGSVSTGISQQQHHHYEHTSIARPIVELVRSDHAADGDRKSSTEEYEKNPPLDAAGTVTDLCNSQTPLVQCAPVMDEVRFRGENVQVNSGVVDRGSDCDAFYQQMSIAAQQLVSVPEGSSADGVGETHPQCDHVPKAAGGNLVQTVRVDSADETNQVYSSEMERHYHDDGKDHDDDDDVGGVDDGGGMQTQSGNVTANENVTVTTGSSTLSAVICLEDGLADDDSWVEEISQDEEEFATTTATDSDLDDSSEEMSFSHDREEELRGYNRTAIDFTLHTIVEESCEDSEIESRGSDVHGRRRGRRGGRGEHGSEVGHDDGDDDGPRDYSAHRLSASELEKYFFYGLGGDGGNSSRVGGGGAVGEAEAFDGSGYGGRGMNDEQSDEESSSLCSDGHDSLGSGTASGSASATRLSGASMESHDRDHEDNGTDSVADLASSRLEKYFLTGFLGYNSTDRSNAGGGNGGGGGNGSDGSGGSVGSDSEGHVSPEQRRKRLVRARGATRSHSSLDNLLLAGKDAEHNHESIGSNVSQSAGSSYDTAGMMAGGSGSGGGNAELDHSSETDTCDESSALYLHQDRLESSPYDTMGKRKKKFMTKKMDVARAEQHHGVVGDAGPSAICSESEDSRKTATPLDVAGGREDTGALPSVISPSLHPVGIENSRKQTSRDSGFIGSNDDLLKEDQTLACSSSKAIASSTVEPILEENKSDMKDGDVGYATEVNPLPSCNSSRFPISPGSSSSIPKSSTQSPGMVNLVRKDSFNNWSSDEETNLMMSKMRQFFKSLVAASANTRKLPNSSSSTPGVSGSNTPQQGGSTPVARPRGMRTKPPQLVYFENELTRLMKTVPGIRDEQVREIVEYLSSEDTWSDSYDSSDYTSSDLEGTAAAVAEGNPFGLQEEISASCRQIINKFDSSVRKDEEGDIGDGGLVTLAMSEKEESPLVAHHRHHHPQQPQQPYHQTPLSKETAFVYQRLVASLSKVVTNESPSKEVKEPPADVQSNASGIAGTSSANSSSSPPLIAKVMHHIGSRLVALMHEVSSGESHASVSPKQHRSGGVGASTTGTTPPGGQEEEDELGTIDGGASVPSSSYAMLLPRSKSHDLLLSDQRSQGHYQYHSSTGSDMVGEERGEASDYERFSWRGSFESALLANGDSRTKLSMLDNSSSSKSILVAKRRSAGDLLFNNQNLSQEQLDRVRSCGSIGGDREEFESSKLWEAKQQQPHQYQQNQPYHTLQPHQQLLQHHQHYAPSSNAGSRRRLSSVAADEEDTDSDEGVMKVGGNRMVLASRSTLPRSLQNTMTSGTTNSLPRLPTSNLQTIMQSVASSSSASSSSGTTAATAKPSAVLASGGGMGQKSQSVYHFLQNNVKSARYRAPGFNRPPSAPKRAMSAPGLQPPYPRRERRNRIQQLSNEKDTVSVTTNSNGSVSKSGLVKHKSTREIAPVHGSNVRRETVKRRKKKWKLIASCGCCCKRKGLKTNDYNSSANVRKCSCSVLSRWSGLVCCCSWLRCCRCCSSYPAADDEDVDAAFAAYKIRLGTVLSDGANDASTGTAGCTITSEYDALSPSQKSTIRKLNKNASWGWNDSFRSVSDRFLESLELDDVSSGDNSLRKKFSVCCRKRLSSPFRESKAILGEIELEESNSPDLTGSTSALGGEDDPHGTSSRTAMGDSYDRQSGDGTASNGMQHKGGSMVSSPVGSAGAGSDNWPSQSDEDIDRLVALHQNRASLSSLGVRSDSMASVYSGAGEGRYGTVTVRGQIEFGMQYNYKQGALEIHVKQCKDLAAVDTKRNRSDPYVKVWKMNERNAVYLLPDKSKSGKRKTKVKKHTLNPVFDEVLRFHMSLNSLQTRTIWITVWHSDMFGRNDFLGEVMMGLQDKVFDNPQPQWYQLQERSEPFEDLSAYKGDIIVGLKYVSADADSGGIIGAGSGVIGGSGGSTGSGFGTLNLRKFSTRSLTSNSSSTLSGHSKGALHVLVKEAKHLQPIKSNGTCDAFCKSYLLPDKNRSSKQKTPVIKRTNSPVWNYTFVYEDVSLAELSERALELTIWDHDRLASNEFLGGVRFSLGNEPHVESRGIL